MPGLVIKMVLADFQASGNRRRRQAFRSRVRIENMVSGRCFSIFVRMESRREAVFLDVLEGEDKIRRDQLK